MGRNVFFIDGEGNSISNDDIKLHDKLADILINQNKELQIKYKQSKVKNLTLFLILEEGYLAGIDTEIYKEISFLSSKISQKERRLLSYFNDEGYSLYDMTKEYEIIEKSKNNKQYEDEER